MKQYIITVIIVGVIGSIVSILSPDGEGGGLKAHVRLAIGLVLTLVCISPLISLVQTLGELDVQGFVGEIDQSDREEYESIFQSGYDAAEIENLTEGIKSILRERFDIAADECYVSVVTRTEKGGKRHIERIFINFYGAAIWKNTGEIESYLGELFGCEVVTAVG